MSTEVRIAGVNLPRQKHISIAMQSVYGIGATRALKICEIAGIKPNTITKDLSEAEQAAIREAIVAEKLKLEGDLRREVGMNIKRKIDIGCYVGIRHRRGLPVRGQRTRTNARTRKGRRKSVQG